MTMLDHARGLLGGDAGRRLPILANRRAAATGLPDEVRAPHSSARFAGLTNSARRDHVARWALQLVADFGAPVAASVVLDYVEEAGRPLQAAEVARNARKTPTRRAASAQETAAEHAPYAVACARGCGHWRPARGPRAVIVVTPACDSSKRRPRRAAEAL